MSVLGTILLDAMRQAHEKDRFFRAARFVSLLEVIKQAHAADLITSDDVRDILAFYESVR